MKYRDTYRIVTQVSRYVSHRDFRYRAAPTDLAVFKQGSSRDTRMMFLIRRRAQ